MNKETFLKALRQKLTGLPKAEMEERLSFYKELIEDSIEAGQQEQEAIAALGSVEEIAAQILSDTPLIKLIKERVKPKRQLRVWEWLLLGLGSPLWLSVCIALLVIGIALYAVLFSMLLALAAIGLAFGLCVLAALISAVFRWIQGDFIGGFVMLGIALMGAGLTVLLCFVLPYGTKSFLTLTKKGLLGLKGCFVRKERDV